MRRAIAPILLAVAVAGCTERPRAPALRDEPVYDNPHLGLRFRKPDNWIQVARTDLAPTGEKEQLVVRFQSSSVGKPAVFEVTARDAPESADVAALLQAPSHSMASWERTGPPEPLTAGGIAATRYTLTQKDTSKESVVFRRDRRLVFLTVVAPTSDSKAREQIRQVIQDLTWTK